MSETNQPLNAQEIEALRGKIRESLVLPLCEELSARVDAMVRCVIEGNPTLLKAVQDLEFKTEFSIEHPENTMYTELIHAIQERFPAVGRG